MLDETQATAKRSQPDNALSLKIVPQPIEKPEHEKFDYCFRRELYFGGAGKACFYTTDARAVGSKVALVAATHKGALLCVWDSLTSTVLSEQPCPPVDALNLPSLLGCHIQRWVSEQRAVRALNMLFQAKGAKSCFSPSHLPSMPDSFKGDEKERELIIRQVEDQPQRGVFHLLSRTEIGDVTAAITGARDEFNLIIYNSRAMRRIYSSCPPHGPFPGWQSLTLAGSFWRRELILYGIAELRDAGVDISKELAYQEKVLARKTRADEKWYSRMDKSWPGYY